MPELPEVETVKRGLAPVMEGAKFARVHVRRPDLRKPFPKDMGKRLKGAEVLRVGRRSKYLLVDTSRGETLIWHLGMSGRVRIYAPDDEVEPTGKHDHVQFDLDNGVVIVFTDPRRFGLMVMCQTDELQDHPLIKIIGPEPIGNAFSGPVLAERIKGKSQAIKQAIMDARVVCGVGNIYASESLFRAGISPKRKAGTVQGGRAEKLVSAIKVVLDEAINSGGSSLRDHRTTDGELGYFQHNFAVYDREGQACPGCDCDISKTKGIQRLEQGGRSTYYCPRKQR